MWMSIRSSSGPEMCCWYRWTWCSGQPQVCAIGGVAAGASLQLTVALFSVPLRQSEVVGGSRRGDRRRLRIRHQCAAGGIGEGGGGAGDGDLPILQHLVLELGQFVSEQDAVVGHLPVAGHRY